VAGKCAYVGDDDEAGGADGAGIVYDLIVVVRVPTGVAVASATGGSS